MRLNAIFEGNTAYSKLLMAVGIILISAVFFTLLSVIAASGIYGISLLQVQTMLSEFSDPKAIPVLKFIQIFSTVGTFIIPAAAIAFLFDRKPMSFLSISKIPLGISALLVIIAMIAALPLINYLGEINSRMSLPAFLADVEKWMKESENRAASLTKGLLEMHSVSDMLFNVFMIALLPAIGEELLFRGIIQRLLSDWSKNIHAGIWISAVLFSAMHMQFYGFIPRMLLGALLGYLLVWSGSLWLPIIAHFINNASAVILMYLFKEDMMGIDPDKVGTEGEMSMLLISVLVTGGLLLLVYRNEKPKIYSAGNM